MKIGVIPPVPMEPFSASTHEACNLWSVFFLSKDRGPWLETSKLAGFPENFSLWSKCLYGMAFDLGLEALYYPEPGLPKEVGRVLGLLKEQDVRLVPFHFPLLRNADRLRDELARLYEGLGLEQGVLDAVLERFGQARTSLRRFDGLQQRSAGFSSREYVSTLARAMDPRRDLEGLKRDIEGAVLAYQDAGRDRWVRLGILGLTPYREGFYEALEERKSVVVFDEWGVENNAMSASTDLASLYNICSLPYGLKRRQEKMRREIESRRMRGVVLSVEYIGESIRDEGFFRANLGVPVFVLENSGGGSLCGEETHGLDRFLESCGRA